MARFNSIFANLLVRSLLLGLASATQLATNQSKLRSSFDGSTQVASTIAMNTGPPLQSLMVCNAYAASKAVDIYDLSAKTHLTSDRPLAYKDCSSFRLPLREGEEFEFRTGNLSVGVFRATGLPRGPASLLLIPHRRAPMALNAAFESHAFADLGTSQLVVLDVYRGKEAGKIKIKDVVSEDAGKKSKTPPAPPRLEDLKFGSVVQVPPGDYQVLLEDSADKSLATVPLHVASENAKYVVLRLGNEPEAAKAGEPVAFPQELVVRQHQESGARGAARVQLLALCAVLLGGLGWWA